MSGSLGRQAFKARQPAPPGAFWAPLVICDLKCKVSPARSKAVLYLGQGHCCPQHWASERKILCGQNILELSGFVCPPPLRGFPPPSLGLGPPLCPPPQFCNRSLVDTDPITSSLIPSDWGSEKSSLPQFPNAGHEPMTPGSANSGSLDDGQCSHSIRLS